MGAGVEDQRPSGADARRVSTTQVSKRVSWRWPIATTAVLAVTLVLTLLQFPFPSVRLALWRSQDALVDGQWWRLVTALLVQYDAAWQIVVVFALLAGIGFLAERTYGHGRWLLLYFGCGVVGQAFGFRWEPPDAGASVAVAGLLGAVCGRPAAAPTSPPPTPVDPLRRRPASTVYRRRG
jgi:membrane associated rhomboid family serine protease